MIFLRQLGLALAFVGLALAFGLTLGLVAAAPALAQVKLGIGAPLSGPDALFGNQIRLGVEQAVSDINAAGGLLGQSITIVPGDDGNDPKKSVEVAKTFVAAKVPFVIGHFSSAATVAASAIYADASILSVTPTAIGPLVTDRGLPLIFRTCGREDQQASVATAYLVAHKIGKIAILHDRTTSGKMLADSVRQALAARGLREVFYGSFEKGTRDLAGFVQRLKASGAQVAFWGGAASEAGLLARQLHDANVKLTILGGAAMASDEFVSSAGAGADGTLMVFPEDPRQRPAAQDLLRRLKAKGLEPDGAVFYAYAAVQILRQAADAARSLEPATVAATLHAGMTFTTVLGDRTFDEKGDPKQTDYAVYIWRRGPSGRMAYDDLAGG